MLQKICESCKKVPATVHLTEIVNQTKTEIHLCEPCAAKKGIKLNSASPLEKLFSGKLFGALGAAEDGAKSENSRAAAVAVEPELICPRCRMTWKKYRETGRLGCHHDYEVFAEKIRPLLDDLHNSPEKYKGKSPHPSPRTLRQQQRLEYQRRLKEAIAKEDYQSAARLRDVLTALEKESPVGE